MRAAANYRNPTAQFEMGQMFLRGEGGLKKSVKRAGQWLQLAAEKGHAGAQALLGQLLFESGKDGTGESDAVVSFGGVDFRPGAMLWADEDGVLVER